jgi:hypothetical protein
MADETTLMKSFCGGGMRTAQSAEREADKQFTLYAKRRAQGAKRKNDLRCAQNAMRHAPSPWPPEAKKDFSY